MDESLPPSSASGEEERESRVRRVVKRLDVGVARLTCRRSLTPEQRQVFYSALVAWVGCSLGLVLAYPALALDAWTFERDVHLTLQQESWFRSVLYLGAIPGSVLGGLLMQLLGPRRLLLLLLPALALTWLLLPLAAPHVPTLIALRALQGVLVSVSGLAVYVYPCEVVEAKRRDLVGALPESAFSLGFLLAYLLAAALHWTSVVLLVPPCLLLPSALAVSLVSESPAWLLHRGRMTEARDVLTSLRPEDANVEKELLNMQLVGAGDQTSEERFPVALLRRPRFLLPVLAALLLVLLKESTGQMVLVIVLGRILQGGGVGVSPLWGCVVVGGARVAANLCGAWLLLARYPRRAVLTCTALAAGVAMVLLANYYAAPVKHLWPQATPFALTLVFVACYGGGVGPVASLMVSEILPGPVRGLGSGLASATLCAAQFSLTFLAPETDQQFTVCCWGYGGGCVLLAAFCLLLPETRHRRLEEVEAFWREATERKASCDSGFAPTPTPRPSAPTPSLHSYTPTPHPSSLFLHPSNQNLHPSTPTFHPKTHRVFYPSTLKPNVTHILTSNTLTLHSSTPILHPSIHTLRPSTLLPHPSAPVLHPSTLHPINHAPHPSNIRHPGTLNPHPSSTPTLCPSTPNPNTPTPDSNRVPTPHPSTVCTPAPCTPTVHHSSGSHGDVAEGLTSQSPPPLAPCSSQATFNLGCPAY